MREADRSEFPSTKQLIRSARVFDIQFTHRIIILKRFSIVKSYLCYHSGNSFSPMITRAKSRYLMKKSKKAPKAKRTTPKTSDLETLYLTLLRYAQPSHPSQDNASLAQPTTLQTVQTFTTYGAYDAPV
jgi:hypothetical protein